MGYNCQQTNEKTNFIGDGIDSNDDAKCKK